MRERWHAQAKANFYITKRKGRQGVSRSHLGLRTQHIERKERGQLILAALLPLFPDLPDSDAQLFTVPAAS